METAALFSKQEGAGGGGDVVVRGTAIPSNPPTQIATRSCYSDLTTGWLE